VLTSVPWRGGLFAAVLACGVLVAGAAAGTARFVLPVLELSVLQILGRLSYSLYLWHLPVAAELQRLAPDWSEPVRWTVVVVVAVALAFVTLALVELPALSSKRRPATRAAVVTPVRPPELANAS
jgi:peptidoglycan/LPS O-acetylase OafA/YrhL